ncbi:Os12g0467450, partial [Oryza sativa Japonica Group]
HFQQEVVMIDGVPKTQCKYCSLRLTATKKSGRSHLINHIAESCPAIDGAARINFLATIKKQTGEGFVFDPKRSWELMVKYFIHAEVPFNKIEDPYFLEWVESVQPTFKVVGRQTLHDDAFNLYEQMREDLRAELQS